MTFQLNTMTSKVISTLLCASSLVACGGGGGTTANTDSVQAGLVVSKGSTLATGVLTAVPAPVSPVAPTTPITPTVPGTPAVPVVTPAGTLAVVTDVRLQNTGTTVQTSVPVTFGQVFAVGHVKTTDVFAGRLEDGTLVALQMDVKARHPDGSVRHAIFSAIIPTIAANTTRTMALAKNATVTAVAAPVPADLLALGFTASTSATIGGVKYTASADQLLRAGVKATWLAGAVANEWQVSAPLMTAAGVAHPHLTARFAIRYYSAVKKARVDVTIENNWAYEAAPQNFTYNAEVIVGGKSVYTKTDLNHLIHSRWRKLFWWGGAAPEVNPMLNTKYLIESRAVPNYDQSIVVSPSLLSAYGAAFITQPEPMTLGLATAYMPTTGAHEDIGLLPGWTSAYVLTMDKRARDATLGTADLAGSWSSHYRDKLTDRPVSLSNYPYMTIAGRPTDTYNPVAKRWEKFPECGGQCNSPYTLDVPHQPSLAYVPYLVTGDYYYLEELQFWAMYNAFSSNPGYRDYGNGLLISEQVRGQAWSLRSLAQAAYITPDADVLKADFTKILDANLDWYNTTYSTNSSANTLNVIVNGYAIDYTNNTGIAPWQDDFFTSAVGHTAELGFTKAKTLLAWKSQFPIGRMTAPGVCWIDAAVYILTVRDTASSPLYTTLAQAYTANRGIDFMNLPCAGTAMATTLGLPVGDMGNISSGYMGYPSNLQPALAYAVDSGVTNGKRAWALFMSRTVKPDYSNGAQFAIIPR